MKKSNERGEAGLLIISVFFGVCVGLLICLWLSNNRYQKVFQSWTGACYQLGGQVQMSGANLVDCFVDSKPCQVDGFQKYETTNPNPAFNNLPLCKSRGE